MQNTTRKVNGHHLRFRMMAFLLSTFIFLSTLPPFKVSAASNLWVSDRASDSITLSWQTDLPYETYLISRADSLDGTYYALSYVTNFATTYTDAYIQPDTDYFYKVECMMGEATLLTLGPISSSTEPLDVTLAAPANLTAMGLSPDRILVTWEEVQNANSYHVYRSTSPSGPFDMAGQVNGTVRSYADAGLDPDTTYYYKVAAVSTSSGEGTHSNVASAKTAMLVPILIPTASATNMTSIEIEWNDVGADSYNLYRGDSADGTFTVLATVSGTSTSFTNTGLQLNTTYYYNITAVINDVEGPHSATVFATTYAKLNTPAVNFSEIGFDSISVTWDPVPSATSYEIKRSPTFNGPWEVVATVSDTTYVDSGLTGNTRYYYSVKAFGENGRESSVGGPLATNTRELPTPSPITYPQSTSSIFIYWSRNEVADVTYEIWGADDANGTYRLIATVTTPYYIHDGLRADTYYYYKVVAVAPSGNRSLESSVVSGKTLELPISPPTPTATAISHESIDVTWTDVSATSYTVYRSLSEDTGYALVANGITSTSYADTGLAANKTYFYKIEAVNASGTAGAKSTAASDKTFPAKPTPAATADSDSAITVTWASVGDDVTYEIWSSDFEGGTYVQIGTSSTLSFTHTGLTSNKTYFYWVRAVGSRGGRSPQSNIVSAKTLSNVPVPTVSATAINSFSIEVSWTDEAVTWYNVYRADTEDGEYNIIASNCTSTTYTDRTATPGTTYYYKVSAITSAGQVGEKSAPANATTYASIPTPTASATALNHHSVLVEWTDTSADRYNIYFAGSLDGSYILLTSTPNLSFTHGGREPNTTYYYKVEAVMTDGRTSALSAATFAQTPTIPAPTPVATALSTSSIKVEWDNLSVAGYYVYRSNTLNGPYSPVQYVESGTSYIDTGLYLDTTYYYKVVASSSLGQLSAWSEIVNAKTFGLPAAPVIDATALSTNSIQVTWADVPTAVMYHVYRASTEDGPYTFVANAFDASFVDTGLQPGTTYYYKVCALNAGGLSSPDSEPAFATTLTPLAAPVLTATATGHTSVMLTWNNVPNATSYIVERSTEFNGIYTEIGEVTDTTFSDDGLTPFTTYYYKVYAKNSSETSASSNIESVDALPYVVTFHPNEGTLTGNDILYTTHGETIPSPANPTRANHTFLGWYTDIDCNNAWDFANHVVTGDITLYASWSRDTAMVTYMAGGDSVQNLPQNTSVFVGNTFQIASTIPTREGYTFVKWEDAYMPGAYYNPGSTITMRSFGVQLVAVWKENPVVPETPETPETPVVWYTVSYNGNAHTSGTLPQTIRYNSGNAVTVQMGDLAKEGYTFAGWKASFDGKVYSTGATFTMPAQHVTFTAQWNVLESTPPAPETVNPAQPPKTDETSNPGVSSKPDDSSVPEDTSDADTIEETEGENTSSANSSETSEANSTSQEKATEGITLTVGNTKIPLFGGAAHGNIWSLVNLLLLIFGFIHMLISLTRKKKDTPQNPRYTAKTQTLMYVGGAVLFLLNLLLLVLTQNFNALMVVFDGFTPFIAILFVAQIASFGLAKSKAPAASDEENA